MMKRILSLLLAALFALSALCVTSTAVGAPTLTGESSRSVTTLADGIVRTNVTTGSGSVYNCQNINVVQVDLANRSVHFDVSYRQNNPARLETTKSAISRFASEHEGYTPVAAFNADMWMVSYAQARILGSGTTYMGYSDPVVKKSFPISRSFNIVDGEIFTSETIPQETPFTGASLSFGITDDYLPVMGNPSVNIKISGAGDLFYGDGINRLPANDALIMYTDRVMGQITDFALDDAYELVIETGYDYKPAHGASITGTVAAIYGPNSSSNPGPITNTQFVLTARGERVSDLSRFSVGDTLSLEIEIIDLQGDNAHWQHVINCVGGNFPLCINGTPCSPGQLASANYPATVIGSTSSGKLVIFTIDGRQSGFSLGLDTNVSDRLMRELGLYNALMLDGGGSASFVVANGDGAFVTGNHPSDGSDRTVNDSIIISVGPQRAAQGSGSIALGSAYEADPFDLRFDSRQVVSAVVGTQNEASARFTDGELELTATGLTLNDPYVYINYSKIKTKVSAGTYKAAALVYRIPQSASRSSYGTEIFFDTTGVGAHAGQSVVATTSRTGKYEVAVFNASSLSMWSGTCSSLRLDFFQAAGEGDKMYVAGIVIAANVTQARTKANAIASKLNSPATSTITYHMNGHGTQLSAQSVPRGTVPVRPADPSENGYVFAGWYDSSALVGEYNFNTVPMRDMDLYAKWIEDSGLPGDIDNDGRVNAADVRLVMRYLVGWQDEGIYSARLDFTGDGKINNKDVLGMMLAMVNG